MKRALLAGWRRQAGLCPGVAPGANKADSMAFTAAEFVSTQHLLHFQRKT